jgi:hypothetical protein
MTNKRAQLLAVAALMVAAVALSALPAPAPRIVAVGDVHGDLEALQAILREARLVDAAARWAGGKSTLVQLGDLIDRGPHSRGVLDFVMGLEEQASRAGGRVLVLLGNHEAMNMLADLRYVGEADFGAYADGKSEQRRQDAWRRYEKWAKEHAAAGATVVAKKEWLKDHPVGFVERREAFGPSGRYGSWLRRRPAAVKIGDTLFAHGGISAPVAALQPNQVNARVAEEFRVFDRACEELQARDEMLPFFTLAEIIERATVVANAVAPGGDQDAAFPAIVALRQHAGWLIVHKDGPLWFRGYAEWSDAEGEAYVTDILQRQGASRVVVGHSPQIGQIAMRWNGRVFLIDTGMLQGYVKGGRGSALEIDGAQITAIYRGSRVPLR